MKMLPALTSFVLSAGTLIFAGAIVAKAFPEPRDSYLDPDLYLIGLNKSGDTFLGVHILISFVLVLFMAFVPTALYRQFKSIDPDLALASLIVALIAFGLQLLLAIIDGWGSPMLGTLYYGSRMHEPRQSAGGIVPAKSPNKPGRISSAEGIEGRTSAKGKVFQSPMPEQSRMMGVSATLERLRRIVHQDHRHDESSLPAARAGCGNSACPDLCAGRSAMTVPTATPSCVIIGGLPL